MGSWRRVFCVTGIVQVRSRFCPSVSSSLLTSYIFIFLWPSWRKAALIHTSAYCTSENRAWCQQRCARMRAIFLNEKHWNEGLICMRLMHEREGVVSSSRKYPLMSAEPFVHNYSASYLTKCSERKEFYLSLHFCVFLALFRLLAQVRCTRTWKTHFSHQVLVREITLRTRIAPMIFVFLLEKE